MTILNFWETIHVHAHSLLIASVQLVQKSKDFFCFFVSLLYKLCAHNSRTPIPRYPSYY